MQGLAEWLPVVAVAISLVSIGWNVRTELYRRKAKLEV